MRRTRVQQFGDQLSAVERHFHARMMRVAALRNVAHLESSPRRHEMAEAAFASHGDAWRLGSMYEVETGDALTLDCA